MSRRTNRERGGVFLFAALAMAALVLVQGGMLTEASQNVLRLAAGQERRQALREGAFAGLHWAALRAPMTGKPVGSIRLSTCKVEVETRERSDERLRLRVVATNQIGETLALEATLVPRLESAPGQPDWRVQDYALGR